MGMEVQQPAIIVVSIWGERPAACRLHRYMGMEVQQPAVIVVGIWGVTDPLYLLDISYDSYTPRQLLMPTILPFVLI